MVVPSSEFPQLEVVRRRAAENVKKLSEEMSAEPVRAGFFAGSDKLQESASGQSDLTEGAAKP